MSIAASLFSWALKKLADITVAARLKPTLEKRIRSAVAKWRRSLPLEVQEHELWPDGLVKLDDIEGRTNQARRALREALSDGFPDEDRWFNAILERWRELHSSESVAFFRLPEAEAVPYLQALAKSLQRVCAQDPHLALPALMSAASARQVPGDAHAEIERAKSAINSGKHDLGWDVLEVLRAQRWDLLSPRERYRVLQLQAHVLMRRGQIPEAAARFLEAASHQPDDDHAKAGLALGRMFLGETEEAFKVAKGVLARTADSMAGVVFVGSAPLGMSLDELARQLPPALLRDTDVARALSQRGRQEGAFRAAEVHARAALAAAPESPEAQAELARALLHGVVAGLTDEPTSMSPDLRGAVAEAQKLLTAAIAKTSSGPDAAPLRLDRSVAHQLLGDAKASDADLHEAYALAPSNPAMAIREAESRRQTGNLQGALEALAPATGDPAVPVMRTQILRRIGTPAALREAQRTLEDVGRQIEGAAPPTRAQYCYEIVAVYGALQQFEEAEQRVRAMAKEVAPAPLRAALLSTIAVAQNDRERAADLAREAVRSVTEQDDPDVRRFVAIALERAGLLDQALAVWRSVVDPRIPTGDAHRFIACAMRGGHDAIALEFCRAARRAGVVDESLLEAHVSLCERYNSFQEALEIVTEQQEAQQDADRAAEFSVPGAYYSMRLGRLDLARGFAERVPDPTKIDPHRARAVVQVLRAVGEFQRAIDYAYNVARLHFDDRDGRLALLEALGFGGGAEGPRRQFDVVEEGAAVRVRMDDTDSDEWYVILDRPDVSASHREFRPAHPHAVALMGHRVGERFEIPGHVQSKTGVITEIVSKESWLLSQALATWDISFPGDPAVVQVRLAPGTTPHEQLAPMLRMIDERQRIGTELLELYKREVVPAFAVAHRLGVSSGFDAFLAFAADRSIGVKCCDSDEFGAGISRAVRTVEAVVDPSALATLFLLGADDILRAPGMRVVVTEGTLQELRQSPLLQGGERKQGTLGKIGEQYVMQEADPSQAAVTRGRLQDFIALVEAKCLRAPGVALASVPIAARTALPELVGIGSAESMAVAAERKCSLWTDDFAVARLAEGELHVLRVTTQWLALAREAKRELATSVSVSVAIGMLLHGYNTTALNGAAVSYAVSQAAGDPSVEPLRAVIDYMESAPVGGPGLANAVANALSDAARHGIARDALQALAEQFAVIVRAKTQGPTLAAMIASELRRQDLVDLAVAFERPSR